MNMLFHAVIAYVYCWTDIVVRLSELSSYKKYDICVFKQEAASR